MKFMRVNERNMIKRIFKSIMAFITAFLIVNLICFFYYNPLHNTELNDYRLEPDTYGLYAVEGFGILHSDKNGFPNRNGELAENNYILVMGSSQSVGDQVLRQYRYSEILDNEYNQDGKIHVYNVAHGGKRFCHLIKNFKDIITEFPHSSAVIIELSDGTIIMSDEEFQDAMQQVEYEGSLHGEELQNHTFMGKISMTVKKYCPFLLLTYDQLTRKSYTDIKNAFLHADIENVGFKNAKEEPYEQSDKIYKQYFQSMRLIREEYSGKIIVVYHEPLSVDELQNAKCENSERAMWLEKACLENEIDFINMKQDFLEEYLDDNSLAYGFYNTEMGVGHLNKTGHRVIAKRLLEELQGREK